MKKISAFLLTITMIFAFASCGKDVGQSGFGASDPLSVSGQSEPAGTTESRVGGSSGQNAEQKNASDKSGESGKTDPGKTDTGKTETEKSESGKEDTGKGEDSKPNSSGTSSAPASSKTSGASSRSIELPFVPMK